MTTPNFRNLENNLRLKLARKYDCFRDVRVFDSGPTAKPDDQVKQFAKGASGYIHSLLTEDTVEYVGLGWGKTVKMIVDGIPSEPAMDRKIWFIPTCGEALGSDSPESSSLIARKCDETINHWVDDPIDRKSARESMRHVSLRGVVDRIHVKCSSSEQETIMEWLVRKSPGWSKIFASQSPLIDKLDVILTSGAPIRQADRDLVKESFEATGIPESELNVRVTHDLGGVLFPSEFPDANKSSENRHKVDLWNERWTGIKLDNYKACAERACQRKTSGVVMVAIGSGKAAVVEHALQHAIVNTLIIDQTLATSLDLPSMGTAPE